MKLIFLALTLTFSVTSHAAKSCESIIDDPKIKEIDGRFAKEPALSHLPVLVTYTSDYKPDDQLSPRAKTYVLWQLSNNPDFVAQKGYAYVTYFAAHSALDLRVVYGLGATFIKHLINKNQEVLTVDRGAWEHLKAHIFLFDAVELPSAAIMSALAGPPAARQDP